jgi:hypothetical protein
MPLADDQNMIQAGRAATRLSLKKHHSALPYASRHLERQQEEGGESFDHLVGKL